MNMGIIKPNLGMKPEVKSHFKSYSVLIIINLISQKMIFISSETKEMLKNIHSKLSNYLYIVKTKCIKFMVQNIKCTDINVLLLKLLPV